MSRCSASGLILALLCHVASSGCQGGNSRVGDCGDLIVDGNVIHPYGVEIVDCERATRVARQSYAANRVRVASGNCELIGLGDAATWRCKSTAYGDAYFAGEKVENGEVPQRDELGRIHAIILSSGGSLVPCYQCLLLDSGAAVVSKACYDDSLNSDLDFCEVLISSQQSLGGKRDPD